MLEGCWPDATELVRSHSAHMITTASGDDDPKTLAFCLTKGIEALIASVDAIGVYWGSATLVTSRKLS